MPSTNQLASKKSRNSTGNIFRSKLAAAAIALALIASGCAADDGAPKGYDDQIDEVTGQSTVETNYLNGCKVELDEELAEAANTICACSYAKVKAEIPFEDFKKANAELEKDPRSLVSSLQEPDSTESKLVAIVKSCISES